MGEHEFKIKDTLIIINSSNRAGKVKTHLMFPKGIMDYIILVPDGQFADYADEYGENNVEVIPEYIPQFLPSQRQYAMEHFGVAYKYIWLMDDDLTFLKRNEEMKLEKCDELGVQSMMVAMHIQLHDVGFPMVGISTRLGNNRVIDDYADTGRVTRCYAMSTEAFDKVGATFAPFEPFVAEDFHMALSFLNKGFNNRILFNYAQEDVGSNAEGGCSLYRTAEVQRKTSFWMTQNHPEVRVQTKASKSWKGIDGKGVNNFRTDMVVSWKKAYKPVKQKVKTDWLKRSKK